VCSPHFHCTDFQNPTPSLALFTQALEQALGLAMSHLLIRLWLQVSLIPATHRLTSFCLTLASIGSWQRHASKLGLSPKERRTCAAHEQIRGKVAPALHSPHHGVAQLLARPFTESDLLITAGHPRTSQLGNMCLYSWSNWHRKATLHSVPGPFSWETCACMSGPEALFLLVLLLRTRPRHEGIPLSITPCKACSSLERTHNPLFFKELLPEAERSRSGLPKTGLAFAMLSVHPNICVPVKQWGIFHIRLPAGIV